MAMDNHLSSLIRKHQKLDDQIARMRGNVERVGSLKKLRAQLKNRIRHLHRNRGVPPRRNA